MRKRLLLFVLMLVASCAALWAQAPQAIAYQSVLRNTSGVLITNSTVSVRISICQGSPDGVAVYVERHIATTNANGLITLQIGKGSPVLGSFADIDWADGPYFAVSEIDPDGGSDYRATIVQQILSVPYALYAERAANCTNEEVERHLETHDAQIARLYHLIDSLHGLAPSDPCLEPIRTVVEQTACDLYEWHGNLYTESGDYTYTTTTAAGCDSTVTLRLSLYQTARYTEEQAICEGSIYVWRGGAYFTTGEYTYTAPAGNTGCDSVLTLRLRIYPSINAIEEQTAEGSFTWIDGNTYTESGDYTYTTTTAAGCDSTVTLRLTITLPSTQTEGGALMGQFAVSATKKVRFSQGNLQYQASSKTWRFAEHQYDYIGANNSKVSSTYSGWIDLFGWGTSGWNSGATAYNPYSTSTTASNYINNNLTGNYSKADWGVYNAISNGGGEAGMWRTLTGAEWNYLFNNRAGATIGSTANARYCKAKVNNVSGIVLFPEGYSHPSNVTTPKKCNTANADYTANIYTASAWQAMEAAGAVFLPAAGYRSGTGIKYPAEKGYYWSSTANGANGAYRVMFSSSEMAAKDNGYRYVGFSVRLVQAVPCTEPVNTTIEQTACNTYEWHGNTYTESGDYNYTTTTAAGCDSTVTLRLRIYPSINAIEEQTAEGSFTWIDGNTYTESGDYTYTTTTEAGCDSMVTLYLTITQTEGGALMGLFSVSANRQVRFSQGNLQYSASGTHLCADGSSKKGTWRFAEHQYDFIGANNSNISSSYTGYIDLFGFGTSGWKSGASAYYPYSTSKTAGDYNVGGSAANDLTNNYANADWGVYNAISNGGNAPNLWRTLTSAEWDYLLNSRRGATIGYNADVRYCKATVNNVSGIVLFPDDYRHPANIPVPTNGNNAAADYVAISFSSSDWQSMETAGAVFLPAAGYRNGTSINYAGRKGYYWSSSNNGTNGAYRISFTSTEMVAQSNGYRYIGFSVRLVQDKADPCVGQTFMGDTTATAEGAFSWYGTEYTASGDYTRTTTTAAGCDSLVTLHLTVWISPNDWVDLGLPSGLLWAVRNVGASSPEEYGNFYAWGETQPKSNYSWETYKYAKGSETTLTKYCNKSSYGYNGYTDNLTTLQPSDDAAKANISGSRMPTRDEWNELRYNCTWTWTTQNGVNGYQVEGPNGNVLFLPAAGYRWYGYTGDVGRYGYYWSSSLYEDYPSNAWYLGFGSDSHSMGYYDRGRGHSVRPVRAGQSAADPCVGQTFMGDTTATAEGAFSWYGTEYTASGDYTRTTTTAAGCDSTVTLHLTVTTDPCVGQTFMGDTSATAEGAFSWYGTEYTASGDYTHILTTAAGCDSTVTLHLTITQAWSDNDWVDLGLPSGLLWAVRNVGASSPEDYGDYFAWGETQPKDNYSWETYRYANGDDNQLTKYCNNGGYGYNGFTDNLRTLTSDDDAAAVNVPGSRMPTRADWEELVNNTTSEWTSVNGVKGRKFTASNGNVLFLPAAGDRWGDYTRGVGSYGYYWSSSLYEDYPYYAWYLGFSSGGVYWYRNYNRYSGFSVRPVKEGNPCPGTAAMGDTTATAEGSILWHGTTYTESGDYTYTTTTAAGCDSIVTLHLTITQPAPQGWSDADWVDLGLPSGLLWATRNVGASSPEDYGDYFAWGETQPKDNYSRETYRYYRSDDNGNGYTKYCFRDGYKDYKDNMTTLLPSDDAAAVNVPGSRMPTIDEWDELRYNCTWTWTTQNGVNGYRAIGSNGNVLFLPAAGGRWDDRTGGVGIDGLYWSSSLCGYGTLALPGCSYAAWQFDFMSLSSHGDGESRYDGYPVRPVRSAR